MRTKPGYLKLLLKKIYRKALQGAILSIKRPGTPHKFDEFSLDAIGTGEGAQVHDKAIQVLDTFYQGQTATSPEAKLAEDVRAWAGIVDGLTKKPREPQRMLSQTPLVFHLLGADFREVYAAPHVFDGMFPGEAKKGHNTHPNIDADILKQLPAALADPIAVFGSDTVDGRLVFMVDVTDANGATVQR